MVLWSRMFTEKSWDVGLCIQIRLYPIIKYYAHTTELLKMVNHAHKKDHFELF